MSVFRLDTPRQTVVLTVTDGRLPCVVYWGEALAMDDELSSIVAASRIDVTGGMLDAIPDLSIVPEASQTFAGQPGMRLRGGDGRAILPSFRFTSVDETDGLTFHYSDTAAGLRLTARFTVVGDMITAVNELQSDAPVHLQWLAAPVFRAPQHATEMIDFAGRWIGEFQENRTPWSAGIRMRENRTGRTGHEHFPALIVPNMGTTNTSGGAYAFHYGWSGGHTMIAEELPDGRRQVQFGHATDTETMAGTKFKTAPLYLTYAPNGINSCATTFQRHLRDHIVTWPKPDTPRPVHYNCWEAIYFDHDIPTLCDIATRAAALGAERFVLDDGWFGKRDDDTTSLGDWQVDPRKYPDGLTPLIDHIHAAGMTFGIWFEPEMINAQSDLFRAHPDWVLGGVDQTLGRGQYVLDMARDDVRDYLYGCIAAILTDYDVDYIKWDHNRVLPTPDAAQTRGTYMLLDALRGDFPEVEIESCASGGGRIDFGIMEHTQRVWLSDSNDALERLRIQHNAALFLPSAVTGSHVGPRVCHTSGRTHDIRFRAWVAAQRHMGFEMDPRELDDTETKVLTDVTTWWKANRDWMRGADILRLDTVDPAVIAEQQLAADGTRFVAFIGQAGTSRQIVPRPIRLTELDPAAQYKIELTNRDQAPRLSRGDTALAYGPVTLSGQYLMTHGITIPWGFSDMMWVLEGKKQ